jgi:hypothetical protein
MIKKVTNNALKEPDNFSRIEIGQWFLFEYVKQIVLGVYLRSNNDDTALLYCITLIKTKEPVLTRWNGNIYDVENNKVEPLPSTKVIKLVSIDITINEV